MFRILFCILLFIVCGSLRAQTADDFADRVTPVLYETLKKSHELICHPVNEIGVKGRFKITKSYLRKIVKNAFIAASLNPSWGTPEVAAVKHLSAQYNESRYYYHAVHWNVKYGTWDKGIEQINEVNLTSQWTSWCRKNHYNYKDVDLIFNPAINAKYAAYLNEYFIQQDKATYVYDGKPHQHKIYVALMNALETDSDEPVTVAGKSTNN